MECSRLLFPFFFHFFSLFSIDNLQSCLGNLKEEMEKLQVQIKVHAALRQITSTGGYDGMQNEMSDVSNFLK